MWFSPSLIKKLYLNLHKNQLIRKKKFNWHTSHFWFCLICHKIDPNSKLCYSCDNDICNSRRKYIFPHLARVDSILPTPAILILCNPGCCMDHTQRWCNKYRAKELNRFAAVLFFAWIWYGKNWEISGVCTSSSFVISRGIRSYLQKCVSNISAIHRA